MHRPGSDYRHKPYKKQISARDMFFSFAKIYIIIFTVLYFTSWFTNNKIFQFKEIKIEGVHASDFSAIDGIVRFPIDRKSLFFWKENNFVLYPENSVRKKIFDLDSRISDVKIVKTRTVLKVIVSEYEPRIRYCIISKKDDSASSTKANETNESNSEQANIIENQGNQEGDSSSTAVANGVEIKMNKIPDIDLTRPDENLYSCYWSDENGYIFAKTPSYSGIPIFTVVEKDLEKIKNIEEKGSAIGTHFFEKDRYHELMTIIDLLRSSGLHAMEIQNLENEDFIIDIGYPWVVVASFKQNPEQTVDNLLLALKELNITSESNQTKIRYIDLRFANKVFYR